MRMHFDGALGERQHHEQAPAPRPTENWRCPPPSAESCGGSAPERRRRRSRRRSGSPPACPLKPRAPARRSGWRRAPRRGPAPAPCSIASKSPAEIILGNSTSSMSSRSFSRARPCCDIDSVMKIFFLLVAIPSPQPLVFLLRGRQRTAPVPSFSRCILLRSTANRSGPPSRAPALGLPVRRSALPQA